MIDYVIRNARLAGRRRRDRHRLFAKGRIAAVERNLVCDAPSHDADGCLCCGGLSRPTSISTSRASSTAARPRPAAMADAVQRVKDGEEDDFTVEDVYARAKETLGELHQARRDAHAHPCRGRSRRRHARLRGRAGAGRRIQMGDRHRAVRVPAGRPDQQSRHRRVAGRRAEARRRVIGAAPGYDTDHAGADHGACSSWRANTTPTSTCISISATRRTISTRIWSAN